MRLPATGKRSPQLLDCPAPQLLEDGRYNFRGTPDTIFSCGLLMLFCIPRTVDISVPKVREKDLLPPSSAPREPAMARRHGPTDEEVARVVVVEKNPVQIEQNAAQNNGACRRPAIRDVTGSVRFRRSCRIPIAHAAPSAAHLEGSASTRSIESQAMEVAGVGK